MGTKIALVKIRGKSVVIALDQIVWVLSSHHGQEMPPLPLAHRVDWITPDDRYGIRLCRVGLSIYGKDEEGRRYEGMELLRDVFDGLVFLTEADALQEWFDRFGNNMETVIKRARERLEAAKGVKPE